MAFEVHRYALTTLERVKLELEIPPEETKKDYKITSVINGASARAERMTGRQFKSRTRSYIGDTGLERLDGTGKRTLRLPHAPVISISSLKPAPDANPLVQGWNADFTLDRGSGLVTLNNTVFEKRPAIVEAVYVGGFIEDITLYSQTLLEEFGYQYAAADLQMQMTRLCALIFRNSDEKNDGISSRSSGDSQVTLSGKWPDDILETLDSYCFGQLAVVE